MSMKKTCSKGQSALGGALLALMVVSILALPASELALGWSAPPSSSADTQTTLDLNAAPSPVPRKPSPKPFDFAMKGSLPFSLTSPPAGSVRGSGLKGSSFNARDGAAVPLFNAKPLFDQPTSGAASVETATPQTKHGVRKKYLAMGILGSLEAAGGAAAIAGSNSVCTTNNIGNNLTAKSICGHVHTAGEVMVPVGAAVAVLGFYLAFRHHSQH